MRKGRSKMGPRTKAEGAGRVAEQKGVPDVKDFVEREDVGKVFESSNVVPLEID